MAVSDHVVPMTLGADGVDVRAVLYTQSKISNAFHMWRLTVVCKV